MKVRMIETCLPPSYLAKAENGQVFHKSNDENLNQFRWRIMKELNLGCVFLFE